MTTGKKRPRIIKGSKAGVEGSKSAVESTHTNPYLYFLDAYQKKAKAANKGPKFIIAKYSKLAAEVWKKMSDAEKASFVDMAKERKARINKNVPRETKKNALPTGSTMASIYNCIECGNNLNLHTNHLYPPDFYFEAGNKGTLSFAVVDSTKFNFEKEDKIMPFFETLNYWGIQRKRVKIKCSCCGRLVGYVYDDGPPLTESPGQFHFGPSQVVPRAPRYRFKNKALRITNET